MISLKTFHYFFIGISVIITSYYGFFEISHPSNPGMISNFLAGVSFIIALGLVFYGINVYKKLSQL